MNHRAGRRGGGRGGGSEGGMRAEGRWEAMGGSDLIVTEWADGGGEVVSVRPPERAGRDVPAVRWVGGGLGVPPPPRDWERCPHGCAFPTHPRMNPKLLLPQQPRLAAGHGVRCLVSGSSRLCSPNTPGARPGPNSTPRARRETEAPPRALPGKEGKEENGGAVLPLSSSDVPVTTRTASPGS